MNKEEFRKHGNPKGVEYYKVHELLNQWKKNNNIPDNIQCVVHHRDDTEECRKYNAEHYEIYGCNLDGTFEYGKYVVFMTNAEHNTYHHKGKTLSSEQKARLSEMNKGEKNGFYGKKHTEETRQRLREKALGRKYSEEAIQHLRDVCIKQLKNDALHYHKYKANGGNITWNAFRKLFHNNDPQIMQYLIN